MRIENAKKHTYSYDENKPIYQGQDSRVYIAMDETFDRKVCLKIISYSNASSVGIANIQKETIGLSRAGSSTTRVPMLFDFWQDDKAKLFYIVMQYIPGKSLKESIKITDARTFINYMISLCDILTHIHQAHVYHKDIKPDNIIIAPSGDVYLIDFNISLGKPNLSEGTICYRAPEMSRPGITVARTQSDLFSIGVLLYEFYAGKPPAEGIDYGNDLFSANAKEWSYFTLPEEANPAIPKPISDIIQKCMKKTPEARYRQASEIKAALINTVRRK